VDLCGQKVVSEAAFQVMSDECSVLHWTDIESLEYMHDHQTWPESHAGTVVPECFKDHNTSQWKSGKFDPAPSETPEPIVTKIRMYDYVGDSYPYAKFHHDRITHLRPPNMRKYASSDSASFFGSSDSLQPRPLHWFLRSIRQMTRFRARMCLLGVPKTNCYISTPFPPKSANFSPIFDGTCRKMSPQKGLNNGDAQL